MSLISKPYKLEVRRTSSTDISVNLSLLTSQVSARTPQASNLQIKIETTPEFYENMTTSKLEYIAKSKPLVRPLRPWKPTVSGTLQKYSGILVKDFPELANVTDNQLDKDIEKIRH
jgi:hypothetical protein